ncbi:GDSL-like lipase/acylhydrolase family protein [Chitinophaga skermanii]|uniref:GDSL-like lipase/acylhydrolase family protein n=1 Tax=Chitinophaga skermanii TaxID=331697 RepID=A0A327QW10_9BACT|nr:SGNH/GDSL hydrolase family protein [Chitinophaga skermanii]RAJ08550.1 GDSL-like lipase/acylhydrolase family protein [Chitinophaga skermanii]
MIRIAILSLLLLLGKTNLQFFPANNAYLQYTGRLDVTDPTAPKAWSPGVYMQCTIEGTSVGIILEDQHQYNANYNYISIAIDQQAPIRVQMKQVVDTLFVHNLPKGKHHITVCKSTEGNIGYIIFKGILAEKLLPSPPKPSRKIEYYGNSITCGTGSDQSVIPCGKGAWHDQHNAYMSYGPLTARALHAQWQLSAVSGIGLMHSCCNIGITMPEVFDKINMRENKLDWDVNLYQPDVVTIALGQNDGIQDSTIFSNRYADFLRTMRSKYPKSTFVLLNSPMADPSLANFLSKNMQALVQRLHEEDSNIYTYTFKKRYHAGCDDHPSLVEHTQIAAELTAFIKHMKHW